MKKDSATMLHAIVYDEGAATMTLARALVAAWRRAGWRVAGLLSDDPSRPERGKCDMILHELASGTRIQISDYRGPLARGCKLDADAFLRAAELVARTLGRADILILNKFGKLECEGGGLRSLIAQALDHSLPIVIFVPRRNLDSWRDFVGELATHWEFAELPGDGTTVSERMGIDVRTDLAQTLVTPLPACATECTQVSRSAGASFSRWEKVPRRGG